MSGLKGLRVTLASTVKQTAVSKYKSTPLIQTLIPHSFVLLSTELEFKMLSQFRMVHDPVVNPVHGTHAH